MADYSATDVLDVSSSGTSGGLPRVINTRQQDEILRPPVNSPRGHGDTEEGVFRHLQFDTACETDAKRNSWHNTLCTVPNRSFNKTPRGGAQQSDYRLPAILNGPATKPITNRIESKASRSSRLSIARNRILLPGSKLDCQTGIGETTGRITYISNLARQVDRKRRYSLLISERERHINSLSHQNKQLLRKLVRRSQQQDPDMLPQTLPTTFAVATGDSHVTTDNTLPPLVPHTIISRKSVSEGAKRSNPSTTSGGKIVATPPSPKLGDQVLKLPKI